MGKSDLMDSLMMLVGQDNAIVIHRAIVEFTGDFESALLLGQLIYWTPRSKMDGWIAKTYSEWQDEIYLSEYAVRKATKILVSMGIVETDVRRFAGSPTVHYHILPQKLHERWMLFVEGRVNEESKPEIHGMETEKTKNPNRENEGTLTEITTEITTRAAEPVEGNKKHRARVIYPTNEWLEKYQLLLGYKITNGGMEAQGVKKLVNAGYTWEQAEACYRSLKAEPFWKDKHLSLMKISTEIGAWLQRHQVGPKVYNGLDAVKSTKVYDGL